MYIFKNFEIQIAAFPTAIKVPQKRANNFFPNLSRKMIFFTLCLFYSNYILYTLTVRPTAFEVCLKLYIIKDITKRNSCS